MTRPFVVTKTLLVLLAAAGIVTSAAASADTLDAIRAEPNLEKRADKALQAAENSYSDARKASQEGKATQETEALSSVRAAVELAMQSLEATGKDARKNPKYFKKAEITFRKLARELTDLEFSKGVDERKPITELIAYLRDAEDKVLVGIMTKKK